MLEKLKALNTNRWSHMQINDNAKSELDHVAMRLVSSKDRYLNVAEKTNVPWFVIAVIHEREASQSWTANLAQGDPFNRRSTHVPRGEGPFSSWEEAAIHALISDDHLNIWSDWSIGGMLTALEKFNGLGYYNRKTPSPYVWAKTNQYKSGKYVADGRYDPNAVDHQDGCAALLSRMKNIDETINLGETNDKVAGSN